MKYVLYQAYTLPTRPHPRIVDWVCGSVTDGEATECGTIKVDYGP